MTTATAPTITADDLLAAGFREFQIPAGSKHHKMADRFFQKCIKAPDGQKLYHVNAYVYDWSKYPYLPSRPSVSVTLEVWAYADESRTDHFTVCYSPEGKSLVEALAFLAVAWGRLSSVPYEREEATA